MSTCKLTTLILFVFVQQPFSLPTSVQHRLDSNKIFEKINMAVYNETPLVATVGIKDEEIVGINKTNWKQYLEVQQNQQDYFYFPLTVEEYNKMGSNIKCIDGQLRMPTWTHVTGVTTLANAANLLAYHLSEQHMGTKDTNNFFVLCVPITTSNMIGALTTGAAHVFSRANINVQLQIADKYQLNKREVDKMVVLKINKYIYEPLQLFQWQHGYTWSYNIPINMDNIEVEELNWFFKQAVEYGGTAMAQELSTMNLNKVIKHCYGLGLQLNRPVKTIERLRGSSTLIQWLLENNESVMKTTEEAQQQMLDTMKEIEANKEEDATKKRKA